MNSDEFFDQLQNQFDDGLPFVTYRKPKESIVKGMLQNDQTLHHITNFMESGFVFSPFDDREENVFIPFDKSEIIQTHFEISNQNETSQIKFTPDQNQKTFHLKLVEKAVDAIREHHFKKVVVSRRESIPISESNPFRIFKNLLNTYPTAFVYFFFHPKVGLWLGATPETLLKIEGNRLTTMALAGTQLFKGTEAVVWQDKERDEQQIVTNFIVDSLQPSVETISVTDAKTMRVGNLLHLQTNISAILNPEHSNLKGLLQNLHPTPAICGLPKDEAKKFILKNENYNREFYSGFLGELNLMEKTSRNSNRHNFENDAYGIVKKVSHLYVNLRCMQLKDQHAIMYVGGGITKDSIPENEWEETVSKSEVIKSIL